MYKLLIAYIYIYTYICVTLPPSAGALHVPAFFSTVAAVVYLRFICVDR